MDKFLKDGSSGVTVNGDSNPDRPYFDICIGMIYSMLFNSEEKMLLLHLVASAGNSNPDQINITTVSVKKLSKEIGKSTSGTRRYIKSLEEKGILIKINNIDEDNAILANTYKILNFRSVWDCKTLDELKKETDRIKSGM